MLKQLLLKERLNQVQQTLAQLGTMAIFHFSKKIVAESEANKATRLVGDSPRCRRSDSGRYLFKGQKREPAFDIRGCLSHLEQLIRNDFQMTEHEITLFFRNSDCALHHS